MEIFLKCKGFIFQVPKMCKGFGKETGGSVAKCRLFSQATFLLFIGNLKWQKKSGTAPPIILRTSDMC